MHFGKGIHTVSSGVPIPETGCGLLLKQQATWLQRWLSSPGSVLPPQGANLCRVYRLANHRLKNPALWDRLRRSSVGSRAPWRPGGRDALAWRKEGLENIPLQSSTRAQRCPRASVAFSEKDIYDLFCTMYVGTVGCNFSSNKVQVFDHRTYAPVSVSLETSPPVKNLPWMSHLPDGS